MNRASAPRRPGAGEVEGAQAVLADGMADELDHVGVVALRLVGDHGAQGGDVHGLVGQRQDRGSDDGRIDGRQVALDVDHDGVVALRIHDLQGFGEAVRTRGMVGPGHHRDAALGLDHVADGRGVGRHHHGPDPGLDGPAPHMDDHRYAAEIEERLVRQAGRGEAGGDEHEGIGHFFRPSLRPAAGDLCHRARPVAARSRPVAYQGGRVLSCAGPIPGGHTGDGSASATTRRRRTPLSRSGSSG
jgi:hypothetical protein